jgi:hypothetical protein
VVSISLASCGTLQVSIETGEDEKDEHTIEIEEAFDVTATVYANMPVLKAKTTVESEPQKESSTADATATAIEETVQAAAATQANEATPSPYPENDRVFLESQELGVTFQYPIMQQMLEDVSYRFDEWPEREWDPTGTFYDWNASRSDSGWRYLFAGGASKDGQEGRARWITDVYRWVQEGDTYYLELSNDAIQEIEPLRIVTREDGLQGLIYGSLRWSLEGSDDPGLAATLNFPEGYHDDLGSITFFFYEEISLDLIR